jgi:hypothetical protein
MHRLEHTLWSSMPGVVSRSTRDAMPGTPSDGDVFIDARIPTALTVPQSPLFHYLSSSSNSFMGQVVILC